MLYEPHLPGVGLIVCMFEHNPGPAVALPSAFSVSGSTILAGVLGLTVGLAVASLLRRRVLKASQLMGERIKAVRSLEDEFVVPPGLPSVLRPFSSSVELAWQRLRGAVRTANSERDGMAAVLSGMIEGVIVTDDRGTVTFINKAQAKRLKVDARKAIGRSFIEVTKDHEMHALVRDCLAHGEVGHVVIETVPGRHYYGVTATRLADTGGCVVVLQDLTELRRLEKVRRDFVTNVSHELRTPLASLKLLAETLGSGGMDDATIARDYLGRIEVEVDRLAQMVDELGELSLVETGKVVLERHPMDVRAVIQRAIGRLEAQAARAGLEVSLDVEEGLPQPSADARRVEQVLVNLMHNAIKFTASGGLITVSARRDDDRIVVSVADTGSGIAEEDLERIFERFYKTDKSRSSQGTGLGLAIARHIVEAHDGTLWAESVEGKGSTFHFSLPL